MHKRLRWARFSGFSSTATNGEARVVNSRIKKPPYTKTSNLFCMQAIDQCTHTHTHTHTHAHTDRHTHVHRQTDRQTDTHTNTHTDRQTHRHTHTSFVALIWPSLSPVTNRDWDPKESSTAMANIYHTRADMMSHYTHLVFVAHYLL